MLSVGAARDALPKFVVRAAQAMAIWLYVDSPASVEDGVKLADHKAESATVRDMFETAASMVTMALAPLLVSQGEIVTQTGVRYAALRDRGGIVLQSVAPELGDPGTPLIAGEVTIERWLQVMIDLPEISKLLGLE